MAKENVYQTYTVVCANENTETISQPFLKYSDALAEYNLLKKDTYKTKVTISIVGVKKDNSQKTMHKKEITPTECVADNKDNKDNNATAIDNIVKELHISEINPKEELKTIINSLTLLTKKLEYAEEAQNIYTKEQDCELHRIEELDMMDFHSKEEELEYKLSIIDNIQEIRKNRRIAKNHANECKEILSAFDNFSISNIPLLESISNKQYTYKLEDGHSTKVYTYSYSSIEERDSMIKDLKRQYSKVLNISDGVIKCYNNCGGKKYLPPINPLGDSFPNISRENGALKNAQTPKKIISQKNDYKKDIKPASQKNTLNPLDTNDIMSRYNVTQCIVAGKRIPTTQIGTTICIKKIPVTSANHIKNTLGPKYKEVIYFPEVEMLILHNRVGE